MRSGTAAGHEGYYHEAALYGSDDEFLSVVVPFLEDGLAAGEPTLAAFAPHNEALVRGALPGGGRGITFLAGSEQYRNPATSIKRYRDTVARHVAEGAAQVRITGDVPHPGTGTPWDWWARYEAAANHAFADLPLWGLCPYDTRTAPAAVLADVERTHPHLATPGGARHANSAYEDPVTFLAGHEPAFADPVEGQNPDVALGAPTAQSARRAVAEAGARTRLSRGEIDDLVLAVSEVVSNGIRHGVPPVELRLWTAPDRVVVTVTDRGKGPGDPLAGLVPARPDSAEGGLGLWIAHQLCSYVTLHRSGTGTFTVRLVAGQPSAPLVSGQRG
ncbi:anti-sigma regulatory factor (Ser/Thr protein kinase) [Prauserella shujinwangii]|uniref:Anti-sigma regulatory factor (Ser/Thr protein kinase) n=1 Tax=Prauserella shujinwangii TaxID=1453103 RepID=A0A2T0LPM5_9PSEU|nr:sensor histidine kinase [Prauserella shujinwangii]PRX45211.1 anti-sigma regulatory factor (Ser/Thr protein kinase) [Prauserella shujinwangii]